MPKRRRHPRKDLILDLSNEIAMVTFQDKYNELSYLDIIQALHISMSDNFKWLRKLQSYRKLKTNNQNEIGIKEN